MIDGSENYFGQYGRPFQERIFLGLITDTTWATQMTEVMRSDFFDLRYLAYLTGKYFKYFEKYKNFPTLPLLISIVKDDLRETNNEVLKEQVVEYLTRMRTLPDMGDLAYVKDKSLDFCRKQAMKEALNKSVELIGTDQYDAVVDLMKKAVSVGIAASVGHDFFEDMEARFVKINRMPCPTGIEQLDERSVLNGGLGKGELGVVAAPTGVGKCVSKNSHIYIKYAGVKIDGKLYKPWDWINTKRGRIRTRDIVETDELV